MAWLKVSEYLDLFYNSLISRRDPETTNVEGHNIIINPGVFPSNSPLTFSSRSIVRSLRRDFTPKNCGHGQKEITRIVDVGTGCGIFSLELSVLFPEAKVVACDIDDLATENARQNIERLKAKNVEVVKSDLFAELPGRFDLIVSSIPFVARINGSWSLNKETLARFWSEAEDRLTSNGLIYFNWADWADFSVIERLPGNHGFSILRIDEYPRVIGDFSWRTYVFSRNDAWSYWHPLWWNRYSLSIGS